MPRKSPPIPVSAAAVAIGVVIAVASFGFLLELSGRFFNSGAGITVPDAVTPTPDHAPVTISVTGDFDPGPSCSPHLAASTPGGLIALDANPPRAEATPFSRA